ncbi:MAG: ISAzo13 family transposase [Tepidiformaceae bacterium]
MTGRQVLRRKYRFLKESLNERSRRLWAAAEAQALGHGGASLVVEATGISRSTVARGLREARAGSSAGAGRVRRRGGGRKRATAIDPRLPAMLESLLEPASRGDPESPLRWTCKSTRVLARELVAGGHPASDWLVRQLLYNLGYSLQANSKTREGTRHPDRDGQFRYINARVARQLRRGHPAISVDTKKKELVGDFKNGGREWRPRGDPQPVRVHDFLDPKQGKVIPYGVYDLSRNQGWVTVGIDHDTASFAVNAIRSWWQKMGSKAYPRATSLLIVADSGGSNGSRIRLWKWELQRLADALQRTVHVSHLPPGTSKWNKVEHRLFSFISKNWRGQPLVTHAVIVKLIASTRTSTGLKVRCLLDRRRYPKEVKVTDAQMATIRIRPDSFHGDWNYSIRPRG